jgi:DNA repair protein RadC
MTQTKLPAVMPIESSAKHMQHMPYLKIQDLAADDRPREKLIQKGASTLTEAELIAILIGSGTTKLSAVNLAQSILQHHDNDLNELAKRSVKELQQFKGIGEAKAVVIISAMELSRRRRENGKLKRTKIESSQAIYEVMQAALSDKITEEFWIVLLTRSNYLITKQLISRGGTAQLAVDPKVVFKTALDYHAASIVLVHNHPSNNPKPSQVDIQLTERLLQCGKVLDIPILDHIIYAEDTYFSFADEHLVI